MSRILVILSGYPCSRKPWGNSQDIGTPNETSFDSFITGSNYLKKLFKDNNEDYICTTWDDVGSELIQNYYNPIIYKSFSQSDFIKRINTKLKTYEASRIKSREAYYKKLGINNDLIVSSISYASQLSSRCEAAKLAINLLKDKPDYYDAILLTRYDISARGGFLVRHPTILNQEDFKFIKSSEDQPRFILPMFDQLNCGLPDMWFYMNLSALEYYSTIMMNYVSDITNNSSKYIDMMTKGWPDSQEFPLHQIYDYRQYSNEMFRKKKQMKLMKYPEWEVSNLHSYHKYFLYLSTKLPKGSKLKFKTKISIFITWLKSSKKYSARKSILLDFLRYINEQIKIFISKLINL